MRNLSFYILACAALFFSAAIAVAATGVNLGESVTIWWRVVDTSNQCRGAVTSAVGSPPFTQWNNVDRSGIGSATLGPFPNPGTYTFSCTGLNQGAIGQDTITVCGAGTSWNGSSCVAPGVSGTINATNNPCTIASGANSCSAVPLISWSTSGATNPVVEVVGSISGSALFGGGDSSPGQPAPWITDYETFTFNLRDNGMSGPILASVTVDGQCVGGTSWLGGVSGSCQPGAGANCMATTISNCNLPSAPSGTSVGSCVSGYGGSCSYTCNNGTWGAPSSNSCTLSCTIVNSSGCGTYGCAPWGASCDCGAYAGWEVAGGIWQTCSMPPPIFTIPLTGTSPINYNTAPTLDWAASPATSCTLYANGVAIGAVPTDPGAGYTPPVITSDTTYRVDCVNGVSVTTSSNTLTVRVRPQVSVTLWANGSPTTNGTVGETTGNYRLAMNGIYGGATAGVTCEMRRDGTNPFPYGPTSNPFDTGTISPPTPGTYTWYFRCTSPTGTLSNESSPVTLTVNPPAASAVTRAVPTGPNINSINIGNFLVGVPATVPNAFYVVNGGEPSSSLTVNTITPSSGQPIVCTTCGPSLPLAPGDSYPVNLAVNIPSVGIHSVNFTVDTTAAVNPVTIQVYGNGQLPFNPTTIDFGRIIAGSFGSTTIKILNLVNQSSLTVPGGTFTFKDPNPSHAPTRPADYVFMCWNSDTNLWATSCPYQAIGPGDTIRDSDGNPFQIRFAPVRPERFQNRGEISAYPAASITLDGWGATGKIRFQER